MAKGADLVGLLTSIGHIDDNEMTEHGMRFQIPPILTGRQASSRPLVASDAEKVDPEEKSCFLKTAPCQTIKALMHGTGVVGSLLI